MTTFLASLAKIIPPGPLNVDSNHSLHEDIMADASVLDVVNALKAKGNELYKKKQYSEAVQEYSRILDRFGEKAPRDLIKTVLCNRAACYLELGRCTEAISDLDVVLEEKEGLPNLLISKAYYRLARCQVELGAYDKAKVSIDNCENFVDPITAPSQHSFVRTSKMTINQKLNGMNFRETDAHMDPDFRSITYDARIIGPEGEITDQFIRTAKAVAGLCILRPPPESSVKLFLAWLVQQYHDEILHSRQWPCWNCGRPAVGLVQTPMSYLEEDPPYVLDFIHPVCVNGGECDRLARETIESELTAAKRALGM